MSLGTPPLLACRCGVSRPGEESVTLRENLGGGAPAQATRVRTFWDGTYWRVLFEVEARAPWATLTQRDAALWTEEVVEVFFDPAGDGLGYFEVEINPLGTVTDLVLRRTASGWRKDFTWQIDGLIAHARRTASGWEAELAIPFAALGADAAPGAGSLWRVNFLRIDRPDGPGTERRELSAWSPTGMANFHRYERFGTVEFR